MTHVVIKLICKPLIVLTVGIAVSSAVFAHGDKKHAEEATEFDAVETEFGRYQPDLEPTQTVEISMADTMRFSPAMLSVKSGDVVRFVVSNEGALQHEFVLGTSDSLAEHADLMIKFPNMEHDEPYMAHVDPGKKMEIVWQFTQAGSFEFGCLLPGHFQAGMKGTVTVK
jgi:uncharacterized cupredoxin-like copper-binding protein